MQTMADFMTSHFEEIVASADDLYRKKAPSSDVERKRDLGQALSYVVATLRGQQTTGREDAAYAAEIGERHFDLGENIGGVAVLFGSISDGFGEIAERSSITFGSDEYRGFNQAVDSSISNAIDSYWRKSLDESNKSTQERVAAVAHELRNALGSAQMAFDAIGSGAVGIHSRTGDILRRSLARLNLLIGQTLAASLLDAGAPATLRPVKLASIRLDLDSVATPERGITLDFDVDDTVEVNADPRLLTSAIGNILHNAYKFTRPGGKVVIRARRNDDDVIVEIEDQCGGLDPGMETKMWNRFEHGGDGRSTGLGLGIVRDTVRAQSGTVAVKSLPGKGCIFCVTLPRSRRPE